MVIFALFILKLMNLIVCVVLRMTITASQFDLYYYKLQCLVIKKQIHSNIYNLSINQHNKILQIQISKMQQKKSNSLLLQQNLITALSFSRSEQFCCIATKKQVKLLVFRVKDISNVDSWQFIQEFHQQSQNIAQIDWTKDDKIISGSHDRSVFIYKRVGNVWQKMLVNIDIKLSILCVKWAPSGKKFALGASCNTVGIGFYNTQTSCWTVSTRSSLSKSPVISLSFHPSSNLLALGSTDNSIKVISCSFKNSKDKFVQQLDTQDKIYQGPFSTLQSLFEVLFSIDDVGGWVNHISFQLNGSFLLVLPHSNHIKLYDIGDNQGKITANETDVKWNGLPFLSGYISDKGVLYAGGFDKKVAVFTRSAQGYTFGNYLQTNEKSSKTKVSKGLVSSMLSGLQKKTSSLNLGQAANHAEHSNPIKILPSPCKKFVVSYDVNGCIHFWN